MTPFPSPVAPGLAAWAEALMQDVRALMTPQAPSLLWSVDEADLPAAADYPNCVLRVADLNILAVSDGSDWVRQDTGAAI